MGGADVPTAPLLRWGTDPNATAAAAPAAVGAGNVLSDIFARVGAFSYETSFKPACLLARADVMVEVRDAAEYQKITTVWQTNIEDHGRNDGRRARCRRTYHGRSEFSFGPRMKIITE